MCEYDYQYLKQTGVEHYHQLNQSILSIDDTYKATSKNATSLQILSSVL